MLRDKRQKIDHSYYVYTRPGAVIKRSSAVWYCTQNCSNWSKDFSHIKHSRASYWISIVRMLGIIYSVILVLHCITMFCTTIVSSTTCISCILKWKFCIYRMNGTWNPKFWFVSKKSNFQSTSLHLQFYYQINLKARADMISVWHQLNWVACNVKSSVAL